MAKAKGPLMGFKAHGSIGQALTYSSRKDLHLIRHQRKQKDYESTARTIQRDYFIEAYEHWNTLLSAEQQQWNDFIN